MTDETKNNLDDYVPEGDTSFFAQTAEEATGDSAGDAFEKSLNMGNDDDESVGSSKTENPGEELRKLQRQLSNLEEQHDSQARSRERAFEELQELSAQGEAADERRADTCRKDADRHSKNIISLKTRIERTVTTIEGMKNPTIRTTPLKTTGMSSRTSPGT